jgi:Thioredoxin
MLKERYAGATTFADFLAGVHTNAELWRAVAARAQVPPDLAARTAALRGEWHLLILSEDWCGDAVNTVPVVARLCEANPRLDCRLLARDANPDLMDTHLTNGSRSIPVVMVLDADYVEHGWWGPRPTELQRWVLTEGQALEKSERYRQVRGWYARDRGRTTLEEILALLERAGTAAGTAGARGVVATG